MSEMFPSKVTAVLSLDCNSNATVCSGANCLVPPSNLNAILNVVLSTGLTVMLAMVMFSMGCTVDSKKLLGHLKRPWGICIGFLCQFGIMPLTAFILSLVFGVMPVQAIAIIIMGCCPGGSGSNIICYWLDGDMDLSISMTACSSILALGMMPLCLFIYTSLWRSSVKIPFDSIGITLAALLIPIGLGMLFKRKWPKVAKRILKVGSILGFGVIVIVAVIGGVLYESSWSIAPKLWVIGTIYPFIGFSLGFFLARFVGQPWHRCRTIALETGFQNSQLCGTIIQLSFTPDELEFMFAFPLIYSIFQLVAAISSVGAYQIYKRRCGSAGAHSDASSLEAGDAEPTKEKIGAMENGAFELDENGNSDEKGKGTEGNTNL